MLDRDKLRELHNSVTALHKTTSLAETGMGSIDWEGILNLTINILGLIKDNFATMHNEFRRSMLDKPESIDRKSESEQKDHQDALSRTANPTHPSLPEREGFPENIIDSVKGNPPNPPLKAEGSPPEKSPVNPTNPNLNKIEESKNNPPERVEPKPTELTKK